MRLRNLHKCNYINDGTRLLIESILVPEVAKAYSDWKAAAPKNWVLIGGVALGYHAKPRYTVDADLLVLRPQDIPNNVPGFKKISPHRFEHKETGVVIEVADPAFINMPQHVAQAIFDSAVEVEGAMVATPSGIVASKLGRFHLQDQADIAACLELGNIDITPYNVPDHWKQNLEDVMKRTGLKAVY